MMEVGFSEILLISVLALIVLGPEKLPKVAAEIGRWVGRARSMARQFRDQLEDEASLEPTIHKRSTTTPATAVATPTVSNSADAAPDHAAAEVAVPAEAAEAATASMPQETNSSVSNAAALSPEFQPDHAELTPHPPMLDDYVASHEAAVAAQGAVEVPHAERLPRL